MKLICAPPRNATCPRESIIWQGRLSPAQQFAWGITRSLCYIVVLCIPMSIPGVISQSALHREVRYAPSSRSLGCEDYLSPSKPRGESLVPCAILIYLACPHQQYLVIINLRPTKNCDRYRQDSTVLHGRHATRVCLFCVTMPQRINPFAAVGMISPFTFAMWNDFCDQLQILVVCASSWTRRVYISRQE